MNAVTVYSKEECSLCEVAIEIVQNARRKSKFDLNIIKLHEGDERFEEFKERFPVIYVNGRFAFEFKVSEDQLLEILGSEKGGK